MNTKVDLFVIGGGSGGVRAARMAATYGATVACAEAYRWGGTCVIRGCVPKKLLVYAAEVRRQLDDARGYGWHIDGVRFDWPQLLAAKDAEIARLSSIYEGLLAKAGVLRCNGQATLVDAHTVQVGEAAYTAKHIVVATGGVPELPAFAEGWLTSNEAFHLPALPASMVIVGSGYVAVEFAHIFAGLGVRVELVMRAALPLRGFDDDVRGHVMRNLQAAGVVVHAERQVVASAAGGTQLTLDSGEVLTPALTMAAMGRRAATAGLGLEAVGVQLGADGQVIVDEWCRSNVPSIYAIGDANGHQALTPIAIREGQALADTLFGGKPTPIELPTVPSAVFAQPPVATMGLTEADARAQGYDVVVFRSEFRPMRHTLAGRDEKALMKLVVAKDTRKVLGAHMVGADAPEIIQLAAVAITMGATKDDFDRTVAIHPTAAEEFVLMRG